MTIPNLSSPLPEAWQHPDTGRPLPGCTGVRKVGGVSVYTIDGENWLSTSSVLRLSPWGRIEHVPAAALDYGSQRGSWVDQCCDLVDDGTLDWESTEWAQRINGLRVNLRPFVEAYAAWIAKGSWRVLGSQELTQAHDLRTFGYTDRTLAKAGCCSVIVDIKTSAVITDREKLQIASYCNREGDEALLLQLTKKGEAVEHWLPDWHAYRARFAALAAEAHRWVEQQEARR